MKNFFIIALTLSLALSGGWVFGGILVKNSSESNEGASNAHQKFNDDITKLYNGIGLQNKLSFDAFRLAMIGYFNINQDVRLKKSNILTIIDFNKPSTSKRFFVIDLSTKKILFNTYTSHGKNTGDNLAKNFSNVPESNKSSLGFYVTAETYNGKHGYSMRLEGKDALFNDNARDRAIVVHGADYVSDKFIKQYGRLGRSQGCPALPNELTKEIIDVIKDGSCLFIYYKDAKYEVASKFLNTDTAASFYAMMPLL